MTNRLYYTDSHLHEFESVVQEIVPSTDAQPRPGVILRETAFYPTSGGQVFDTGWLTSSAQDRGRVAEVVETEDGRIGQYLEAPVKLAPGGQGSGSIGAERRRDPMQQHS